MGVEQWVLFKSPREADGAKDYLSTLMEIEVAVGEYNYGCWLRWSSRMKLEIGRTRSRGHADLQMFVQREICRRYAAKRIGADSAGWWNDREVEWSRWGPTCKTWVDMAKAYTPKMSYTLQPRLKRHMVPGEYEETLALLTLVSDQVSAIFKSRDVEYAASTQITTGDADG